MAHTLTIGSIRCHILSDGLHHVDGGGFFGLIPRTMWQRVIVPDVDNRIPVDARSLLIESDAGLILVDMGFGDKYDTKARGHLGIELRNKRLLHELQRLGVAPADIDIVLFTHFHGDHVGGSTRWAGDDAASAALEVVFPNARHIGQRVDFAAAQQPNERTAATYLRANWEPLQQANLLEIVDGPQQIASGVRTQIAPGHTQALQVVWVESEGESLLFLSDAANWGVHLERLAWVPAFDILPMTSIDTKRALRQEAMQRDTLLVFQHDAHIITARLRQRDRGPALTPEIVKDPEVDESK